MQIAKPEHHFHVADPEIIGNPQGKMLVLRFQTVEPFQSGHRRSGKYIHLELTVDFAMNLLGGLKAAQAALHLSDPPLANTIVVPPAKDRN
jgi:hypothetical protein